MPRKKTIKRNAKAKYNFSKTALSKVEKEFFTLPTTLVRNAVKQLTILQKRNSKLNKVLSKTAAMVAKLEKKLSNVKHSKKIVKKSVVNALNKQHQAALKQHAVLSKEHQEVTSNLLPLEAFNAKFTFLSKQLVQLDKEWLASQKNVSTEKKPTKQKKTKIAKKHLHKAHEANVPAETSAAPIFSNDDTRDAIRDKSTVDDVIL